MRISEAYAAYFRHITIKNYSDSQVAHAKKTGQLLADFFGDIEVSEITEDMVYDWRMWLLRRRCANTVRQYILNVRAVLNYCRTKGEDCLDTALIPTPRREITTPSFLSSDEVRLMINAAHDVRAKFVISFLYSSGVRVSEFISLNRGQIHDGQFTVVGKGRKERLCFIDRRTERLMEEYLETRADHNDALVVSRQTKERLTKSTVELIVKNTAKWAGITKHVTPHTFRHSFATNFLENNGNVRYLADMLGHKSLDTTAVYTHIVNNDLRSQYNQFHSV